MQELTNYEIEQVNGGIIPVIAAIVATDAALIGTMFTMISVFKDTSK
ncbi:class IIb bacteriocin, lactobin A/cerein 7B family [Haliea sp. E17]